jgi:hypothetical protein
MKFKFALFVITLLALSSCTDNMRARQWGGKENIVLKPNEKLINITWKDNDMWVLTEDTLTHVNYFRESSSFGVFNGEITIKKAR